MGADGISSGRGPAGEGERERPWLRLARGSGSGHGPGDFPRSVRTGRGDLRSGTLWVPSFEHQRDVSERLVAVLGTALRVRQRDLDRVATEMPVDTAGAAVVDGVLALPRRVRRCPRRPLEFPQEDAAVATGNPDRRRPVLLAVAADDEHARRAARNAASRPWSPVTLASFVMTNSSSRASSLARIASPTPASLRYAAAVSIDRDPVRRACAMASAVCPGETWKTPKPSWGMRLLSFSSSCGPAVVLA